MTAKIFRDPLYNYVGIDASRDAWLLELIDTPEFQRLRRIHQLGVSSYTYPGADHSRFIHSLGVLHLMQQAVNRLHDPDVCGQEQVNFRRAPLLAAALLHDIGHGAFSHLIEPCLGVEHENWSTRIILEDTAVNRALKKFDGGLPAMVAGLIDKNQGPDVPWHRSLLSSQLDMDRLDYLRRDSLFTGAGYGHFDWFRILHTFELFGEEPNRDIVWPEKSMLAIEEYIFSRYYMYQNVYLHKTTRGFEKLLEAMWYRARQFQDDGQDALLLPAFRDLLADGTPTVGQYLRLEEFAVLSQIECWTAHRDKSLADLARRFLSRQKLAMIEAPEFLGSLAPNVAGWEEQLLKLVRSRPEYDPPEMYCLKDELKGKYSQPYFPEKESDEQSAKNAIRIRVPGESQPVEISRLMPRLVPLMQESMDRVRYYIPQDLRAAAKRLRDEWKP